MHRANGNLLMDFKEEKKGKELCNLVFLSCAEKREHIKVFICQSGKSTEHVEAKFHYIWQS